MVKPLSTKGRQVLWRKGYPKYDIEEIWDKNKGLIGANYYTKQGLLVKTKLAVKGKRTEW